MKKIIIAWAVSIGLIAGSGAYIWSAEVPKAKPAPDPVVKVVEEAPPVLSTGQLALDLTPPEENPEDCPGTC